MTSLRENILQEATTKNQEFQSISKSMNSFLENLPTNKIYSNDDLSQVTAKQSAEEVRLSLSFFWRTPLYSLCLSGIYSYICFPLRKAVKIWFYKIIDDINY